MRQKVFLDSQVRRSSLSGIFGGAWKGASGKSLVCRGVRGVERGRGNLEESESGVGLNGEVWCRCF